MPREARTTVTIDPNLKEEAIRRGYKISLILDGALRRAFDEESQEELGWDALPEEEQKKSIEIVKDNPTKLRGRVRYLKNVYGIHITASKLREEASKQ